MGEVGADGFLEFFFDALFVFSQRTLVLVFGEVTKDLPSPLRKRAPLVLGGPAGAQERGRIIKGLPLGLADGPGRRGVLATRGG